MTSTTTSYLLAVLFPALFLVGFFFAARRMRKGWSPRQQQRQQRRAFYFSFVFLLAMGVIQAASGQLHWGFFALWGICIVIMAYSAFRKPSPHEFLQNFAQDPQHCGGCGYDLTGNVSGICPECGWSIPASPPVVESLTWALWWKEWEIPYLRNWRRTLLNMIVITAMFLGVTMWLFVFRPSLFVIVPALMTIHFIMNIFRVAEYARRHRTGLQ